ncbi:3'(2'),5'-bisphosphate nucleotidase [Chroococcidiopsis sp. FACHB-1243]|uniref:3'(2'),5'-bisphosphate nucleotidase n=1 Tax=Chroococcidiopsis sp. [FACHB-1243] TaxID=2692781 RepID=UPI00177F403A|nr:3'(2'),5'-bisphosphate nucleotidase [Chroococcidiopsis sp. [FACHB-1243]]MBD2307816.1 3'(2'),5'-bisphosphate nucleotidase [Chroococcidiopsis sp. [FACHB-1243]]
MAYELEKQVAIASAIRAIKLCTQIQSDCFVTAIEKPDFSPVTIADLGAQAIICQAIAAAFPQDAVVGEEDAKLLRQSHMAEQLEQIASYVRLHIPETSAETVLEWIDRGNGQVGDRFWTLDPIDGTKGFLRGNQYAIALALIEDGEVKLGVMGCPALPLDLNQPQGERGVLFVAVRGQGTTQIALKSGVSQPILGARTANKSNFRSTESVESRHGNLPLQRAIAQAVGMTFKPLSIDSMAKYAVVARGEAALYLRMPWAEYPDYRENIWDHAAGAIVLEEAGGRVSDMYGKPLEFATNAKMLNNRGIIASSSDIYDAVLDALQEKV